MKNFIVSHLDFNVYPLTWLAIICFLLIFPCTIFLPEHYGFENSLLENLQLAVLLLTFIFAMRAKENKTFFYCMAMIVVIIFLREVNCGRTIFFPVPGEVNSFYSWKEIKYGWLAHPLYGLYIVWTAFYFLKNKLFLTLWDYVKNNKFPFWNMLFVFVGMGAGLYSEKTLNNMVLEEMSELLFYVALAGLVYLYSNGKTLKTEG